MDLPRGDEVRREVAGHYGRLARDLLEGGAALIDLGSGQVVLDLGSGGGIDVLLSARRVGPHGKVHGFDMADDMLELARKNQREAGIDNVEFLKGIIEAVPLPDESIDVVI